MLRLIWIVLSLVQTNIHIILAMSMFDIGSKFQSKGSVSLDQISSNDCSKDLVNIDTLGNQTDPNETIVQFTSSWQRKTTAKSQTESSSSSTTTTESKPIQMIFTVPNSISSQTILVKRFFITEEKTNKLLASITENICSKNSSFYINYLTEKALPHTICLNLLVNQSLNNVLQEIFFCRTIDDFNSNDSSSHETDSSHAVGPSQFFILSQCIIILIMMFIIFIVQTVREKSLMQRLQERFSRSRPYKLVFGHQQTSNNDGNELTRSAINPATTLQAGLNCLVLSRNFASHPNHQLTTPLQEQVLNATDLTSAVLDRVGSRPFNNRDLLDVKELTKRMSVVEEHPTT